MNQLALELDINSAVDNIRDVVLELLHCERVTLFLVDNQQKELRYMTLPLLCILHCNCSPTCCKTSHICCTALLNHQSAGMTRPILLPSHAVNAAPVQYASNILYILLAYCSGEYVAAILQTAEFSGFCVG